MQEVRPAIHEWAEILQLGLDRKNENMTQPNSNTLLPARFAERAVFRVDEVAELIQTSVSTLRRAISENSVRVVKVGKRRIAIPRNEVIRILEKGI